MAKFERLITPKGVKNITENGEFDVVENAKVFVDVEGKVEIPQVSNLAIDEDGILTFDLPDYSELEQYNPTISYIININDNVLETSGNSADVKEYATEGENNVVVTTKVTINGLGKDDVVDYVPSEEGKYTIITLNLDDASYLQPQITMANVGGTLTVDWGDGTTDTALNATTYSMNNVKKSTPYATTGVYTIKAFADFTGLGEETYIEFYQYNTPEQYRVKVLSFEFQEGIYNKINNNFLKGAANLTSIAIPDSVTSIGGSAFYNCTSLTNITIPDSVTSIGNSALRGCTALMNITIPNSVTSIATYAFNGCSSLTSITIPESVTSIANNALYVGSTTNKATITFKSKMPPSIESNTFIKSWLQEIRVPASAVDTYKTATNWTNFANYIVADTEG